MNGMVGIFKDMVEVEREVVQAFGETPDDASRSIDIVLVNNTDATLNWSDSGLDHGTREIVAPDFISPGDKGRWMLVSNGFATGCEGWMNWKVGENGPMLKLNYDNPFSGSNSYSNELDPESSRYEVERSGGGGDNTRVIFHLKLKR